MKKLEKFLIRMSLNGKTYPIYWIIHELINSETNIYFGSYIVEHKSMKTSVHSSGRMHTKNRGRTIYVLSHPQFDQKLDNFKGMKQIQAGVIFKSQIEHYPLRIATTNKKQIIDIDISNFVDPINLQIAILENENYSVVELYKNLLHVIPKFEEFIMNVSPWLYIVAF